MNELVCDSVSTNVSTGLYVNGVLCICCEWEQYKREKGRNCLLCR